MTIEMQVDKELLDKYKTHLLDEKAWLKKEIEFLTNRLKSFNEKTPQELIDEVKTKRERYERDLKFYEDNYKED